VLLEVLGLLPGLIVALLLVFVARPGFFEGLPQLIL
jgi:hypothetical protein